MRRRVVIESTLSAILSDVVDCSRELRKQSGHSAQERRMALSILLLLLQKIEMRHAVTDDMHMYIAESITARAFPGHHLDDLLVSAGSLREKAARCTTIRWRTFHRETEEAGAA